MNATTNRWEPEQGRLWAGSALAALLLHLLPAALLILYIHQPPPAQPLAGANTEMDVDLPATPSAGSPATSTSQQASSHPGTRQASGKPAQLTPINPVRPLGEMPPVPQPDSVSSNAGSAAGISAANVPAGTSDLGSAATGMTLQLWLEEVRARLQSHMEYPDSAIQKMQQENVMQDTVNLQFSVDRAGHVTYSHVDSEHHYQDLEQEAQVMLRLASALPAPPAQLAADAVVTVPVQFYLETLPIACSGPDCSHAQPAQRKPHAAPPPPPTLDDCKAAASPGPPPAAETATLEQMRAYRDSLNQYLAASGNQLACLSAVKDTSAPALRDALARQLHSMVDGFNTQARLFQAKALQAQQAREEQQARALSAQVYGACTAPADLAEPGNLSGKNGETFRRQLIAYQAAVRSYVACLQQAAVAATNPARTPGLTSNQRALLHQSAAQLGNAAIRRFNQVAGNFNAQVPQIRKAIAAQEQLAEAVVRSTPIFPTSSWRLPVPLPSDECVYITQVGQNYFARLCHPAYVTNVTDLSQQLKNNVNKDHLTAGQSATRHEVEMVADNNALPASATQQEAIAARHGFPADGNPKCRRDYCPPPVLGITITTQAGFGEQSEVAGSRLQTVSYSVSGLRVQGRRVSMTISRKTEQSDHSVSSSDSMHFDLVLSPDNQALRGYCWMGQQPSKCILARRVDTSAPDASGR